MLPLAGQPASRLAPNWPSERSHAVLRHLLLLEHLDARMLSLHRQGRLGFYGPSAGQEAAVVGSAAAAQSRDPVFPGLREGGILLWRGQPLERWIGQLMGRDNEAGRGRQQPMHFSGREHEVFSLSSPIGTQLTQAVGAARALQLRGAEGRVVFAHAGDGATSTPEWHAAATFAGVWRVPVVFVLHNNGWALSTPVHRQSAEPRLALKAAAYGFSGRRVDGNDVLAVTEVLCEERRAAQQGPRLVELLTHRRGGHSSADDPDRYRSQAATPAWLQVSPIERFERWMVDRNQHDPQSGAALRAEVRSQVEHAIQRAEAASPPPPESLFQDVLADSKAPADALGTDAAVAFGSS